jgi:hypothetical protein
LQIVKEEIDKNYKISGGNTMIRTEGQLDQTVLKTLDGIRIALR